MTRLSTFFLSAALMTMGANAAMAASPSSVNCSALGVTITFDAAVTGSAADATKVGIGSSSSGPFMALSSSSTVEVESGTTLTILLTEDDVITHESVLTGSCYVQVQSGFTSEVTASSSHSG
ncbi:MAG: hypothetical protein J4F41_06455 [Alphaproteobacteria bacterium]|nr:hypothetical protein [Alphaproteobacteria bacterium]